MKRFEIFFGIIKIPIDFFGAVLGFLAAYNLRLITEPIKGIAKPIDYTVLPALKEYFHFSLWMGLILIIIFALGKMYSLRSTISFGKESRRTFLLCLVWIMFMISYFFFTRTFPFSRLAIIYSWLLAFFFIFLGRSFIRILQQVFFKMGIGKRTLIFIGNNELTLELSQQLLHNKSYKIAGFIGKNQDSTNQKIKYLGSLNKLKYILKKHNVHEIIQTKADIPEKENAEILELCDLKHISYRFIPDLIEMRRTNLEVETIYGIPIITLKHTPLDGWGKVSKRIIDIIGATFALIIFSPILLITTIAIKLDSKGPILFTKLDNGKAVKRVGQLGKLFPFYKFRSMKPNTDSQRYDKLAEKNIREEGPLVKIKNDPRITKVGNFIRKYSIDELPQLYSILIGDMSLVGPRPHLPEEVKKYQKHEKFVLTIKPGLTGLPQISGRSDLSFEDEIKLDRFYIENWSIWMDLKIILKTFSVVFRGYKE
jgi:exopolysaccharide biosynthesis polyprenyl glycosylphosphotransferase